MTDDSSGRRVDHAATLAGAAGGAERRGDVDEALALWLRLDGTAPGRTDVDNGVGRSLARLGRVDEALARFDAVLRREPGQVEALFNRGNALRLLGRHEEAIEAYREVLPLDAEYARAGLVEIGRLQQLLHDDAGARTTFLQLFHVDGGSLESIGYRVSHEHHVWPPDPARTAGLARELGARYAAQLTPTRQPAARDGRLRIGLVSADLGAHPVGFFAETLLASSAARDADWVVYSARSDSGADAQTARLRGHATLWHEAMQWSDDQLAEQVRDDAIDVLVDLAGFSAEHRLGAFASRPAPLQLSWLGYHGTTGLPFIDAVLADPHCVPPGEEHFFTESVVRLPHTRLCFTPPPDAPPIAQAPVLCRGAVTFGCFQQNRKIGPQVLEAWGRIAQELPEARWVIALTDADATGRDRDRLRRRAAAAGLDPARVEIVGRRSYRDYLAGYAEVDLVLDTFPYPGGTTTGEALWMGVPTLTLSTPGMLGRQGAQVMTSSGLPEWVTTSLEEYVAQAVDRGRHAARAPWTERRPTMREHLKDTPFFDGERFGRDWMAAVVGAWRSHSRAGSPGGATETEVAIARMEGGDYTSYFFVPDHAKESGGVKLIYDHVRCLNRHGHQAVVVHEQAGFAPEWLAPYYDGSPDGGLEDVPVRYLSEGALPLGVEDQFVIPEVRPDLMERRDIRDSGCHRIVLCQNWYYVLQALPLGTYWDDFGIIDCLSVSGTQTAYLNEVMPQVRCKQVVGHVPGDVFHPPRDGESKHLRLAFIPSRDGGAKAHTVLKTFHALHPHLRSVELVELRGLPRDDYARALREATFYVHLDEASSWGTAPIEAFLSGCLVAGWDGVGGREYLDEGTCWLADNGDVTGLARAIGRMVDDHLGHRVDPQMWVRMAAAAGRYTLEAERESVLRAHAELRQERIAELRRGVDPRTGVS